MEHLHELPDTERLAHALAADNERLRQEIETLRRQLADRDMPLADSGQRADDSDRSAADLKRLLQIQAQVAAGEIAELRRQLEEAQRPPSAPLDVALSFIEFALTGKEPASERGNGLAGLADVRRHVAELRRQLAEVQAERDEWRKRATDGLRDLLASQGDVHSEATKLVVENLALRNEVARLTTAGLDAAYGETIKADEVNDYYEEAERLRNQLSEAQRWQPVEDAFSIRQDTIRLHIDTIVGMRTGQLAICRLVEGQPAATEQR